MNTQPTALRLADAIMLERPNVKAATRQDAAAKLRHLHSLNQELVEALEETVQHFRTAYTPSLDAAIERWKAALAKARGKNEIQKETSSD